MNLPLFATASALAFSMSAAEPAQGPAAGTLGTVTISRQVLADGQRLAPGTYEVTLTSESPEPVVGQRAATERWVHFGQSGRIQGRALAIVVMREDVGAVTSQRAVPPVGAWRSERLRESDGYVRLWFNRGGDQVLVHLPYAAP